MCRDDACNNTILDGPGQWTVERCSGDRACKDLSSGDRVRNPLASQTLPGRDERVKELLATLCVYYNVMFQHGPGKNADDVPTGTGHV